MTSRRPSCLASFPSLNNTIYRLRPYPSLPRAFGRFCERTRGFLFRLPVPAFEGMETTRPPRFLDDPPPTSALLKDPGRVGVPGLCGTSMLSP